MSEHNDDAARDGNVQSSDQGKISAAELDKTMIPTFDASTSGDDIITALKELEEGDALREAALDEFSRRARRFDLDLVNMDLVSSSPFYAAIARRVNKVKSARLPTAAVTIINDAFVMFWNPGFFTRIAPDYAKGNIYRYKPRGVCIHEYLHLILEHVMSSRTENLGNPTLANWAADLAINCMIPEEYLPDGLLVPGKELEIPDDYATVYRPEELKDYKKLGAFVKSLKPNQAMELYYTQLLEFITREMPQLLSDPEWGTPADQPRSKDQGQLDQGQPGQGQPGQGQPGQGQGQPGDQPDNGDGTPQGGGNTPDSIKKGFGRLGNFDNHNHWDSVGDAEREFIKQRVKSMLRDAANEADNHTNGNGWGNVPHELEKLIRKLISDQIDWRALLRQFVGYSQHLAKSSTIKRINKRFAYIHPGKRRSRGATLWVYIDQSGSVSDKDIALLFGELDNLAKKVSFRVYFFDTEVDTDFIDWRRGQKHPAGRRRQGGTDFDAPTRHANKHKGEMDGVLILSDGECQKPGPCLTRRAWIITPDNKLHFETDEMVIQMTHDKAKVKSQT